MYENDYHRCCCRCKRWPCICYVPVPGPTGEPGPAGEPGPPGPPGPVLNTIFLQANTIAPGTIPAESNVVFPQTDIYLYGITVNDARDTFTLTEAGAYFITYTVRLAEAAKTRFRIMLNDRGIASTQCEPTDITDIYTGSAIEWCNAGDEFRLRNYEGAVSILGKIGVCLLIYRIGV